MNRNVYISTRNQYMAKGRYWELFSHLYETATDQFKKRMRDLKEQDQRYVKAISHHYVNERK